MAAVTGLGCSLFQQIERLPQSTHVFFKPAKVDAWLFFTPGAGSVASGSTLPVDSATGRFGICVATACPSAIRGAITAAVFRRQF